MDDLLNNPEELDVAAAPENSQDCTTAEEPQDSQDNTVIDEPEISQDSALIAVDEDSQAVTSITDPEEDELSEESIQKKAKVAKGLGKAAIIITAIKIILCPILSVAAIVFDLVSFFWLMMGGALMLAMAVIAMPVVSLIIIVVGAILVVAAILLELSPIILGIIARVLSSKVQKSVQASEAYSPECQKAASSAKKVSLIGFIISLAAEPIAMIPALLLVSPILFLVLIGVVYLFQMIGLAMA